MSLLNLRMRGRLYIGFGALVLFGLTLAAFAAWQLGEICTQVAAVTLQSTNTIRVEQIELYNKGLVPVTVSSIERLEGVKESIGQAFRKTATETDGRIATTVTVQEIVTGAAALLGLVIAFLIARSIISPLSGLTSGMKELASGNFSVVLP